MEKSDDVRDNGDGKPAKSWAGRRLDDRASGETAETVRPKNESLIIYVLGAYSFASLVAITYMAIRGIAVPESLILTLGGAVGYLGSKLTS